jgi:predicted RND superfamily exporter protein
MEEKIEHFFFEEKINFLHNVLEAAEKRRNGVENKASILIAANAILLSAIGSFFNFSSLHRCEVNNYYQVVVFLLIAMIICVISSIFCSLNVLTALTPKKRQELMNVSKDEFNVFFIGKIAEFKSATDYHKMIKSLSQEIVLSQYTNQAFNLSRLVMARYRWFNRSKWFLLSGIIIFVLFVITIVFLNMKY